MEVKVPSLELDLAVIRLLDLVLAAWLLDIFSRMIEMNNKITVLNLKLIL